MTTRRERVVLELEDNFTAGAARAAAATEALKREINGLNGSSVHLDKTATSARGLSKEFDGAESSVSRLGKTTRESSADLNKFTGRLSLLATAGATLGPALLPIGAVAVPAITALAGGMGAAAGAAGVALLAFHGFGDALKALNAYQLEPTAAHLQKVQETMGALSPAAQDLVKRLDGLGPVFDRLRANAGAGMFPGLNEGLDQILTLAPEVNAVIASLSAEMGKLANDAGAALKNDADWQAFFEFLRTDAAPTLDAFARATGNVIAGLGSMLVAFAPLSRDFSTGMLDMSRSFRDWAANLGGNAGFQHFVDYIRENGPAVRDFFVAVAQALGGLAHAAAPWGAAVLPILTDTAKVFATIADSPIGPTLYGAAAAMLVFNRASLVFGGAGLPKLAAGIGTTRTAVSGLTTDLGIVATTWMTAGATTEREAARMAAARQRLLATGATSVGARAATGAIAVSAGGDLITKGYDKLGGNANTVGLSLMNGGRPAWQNPLAAGSTFLGGLIGIGGYNPEHIGDKGPVRQADAGLAQMVGAGRSTEAAQQLKKYADAANMSVKEAQKSFPLYTAAITEAARSTDTYGAATATAAGHMHAMALESEAARKRLDAQRKAARQTGESFTAFGSNLNDSKVSLQSWIKSMADQAKALRDFTKNAQTAAKRGLRDGLIRELEAAGPAGAMRLKQLAGASQSEIGRANRAWAAGRAAIRAYVAMKVPPKKIDVNNDGAISAIEALQARINALHGKTITNVVQMVQRGFDSKRAGLNPSADGSTVPKTGLPYADRHLYLLADGEEVISNRHGQADRHRALLKAINANRLADGGHVGPGITRLEGATHKGRGDDVAYIEQVAGKYFISLMNGASFMVTKQALKGFDGWKQALAKMRANMYDAGHIAAMNVKQIQHLSDRFDDLSRRGLHKFGAALNDAADAVKQDREALISRRDQLRDSVRSGLTSNIWAERSSTLPSYLAASQQSMPADPLTALRSDVANAKEFKRVEQLLAKRGLRGAAFEEAAGNGGLAGLEVLAGYSKTQLSDYMHLFNQRNTLTTQAANYAGREVYGAQIDRLTAEQRALNKEIRELNAYNKRQERARAQALKDAPKKVGQAAGEAAAREINKVSSRVGQRSH